MWCQIWNLDTFIFSGLLWPPQPRRSDGKPQILMWILMWKKGKNLVYLYVKLSILSIGGPRLIFMNSNKCPTMWLIKKWDVALSSRFVWRYSFSQLSIRNLGYLVYTPLSKFGHTYIICDNLGPIYDYLYEIRTSYFNAIICWLGQENTSEKINPIDQLCFC